MTNLFEREQLYELVWSQPMQKVAASLTISDVGLAKACRRAAIPVPERGYWAKLQAGKQVERRALPPRPFGSDGRIAIGEPPHTPWRLEEKDPEEPGPAPVFAESIEEMRLRARQLVGLVAAPKNLAHPHSAIRRLVEKDEKRRAKQASSPYPSAWDAPIFESAFERRRLRLLNAIFLTMERCRAIPSIRGSEARELSIFIGTVGIAFKLDRADARKSSTSKGTSQGNDTMPAKLRLELERWSPELPVLPSWEDRDDDSLESRLTEICVEMLVSSEVILRHFTHARYQEQVAEYARFLEQTRKKAEQEEQAQRARIQQERQQRLERLIQDARRWRAASDLRAYAQAVVASKTSQAGQLSSDIQQWVTWVTREADGLDPLLTDAEHFRVPRD